MCGPAKREVGHMGKVWTVLQRRAPGERVDAPKMIGRFDSRAEADAEWRRIILAGGTGYVVQAEARWEG